MQIRDHLKYIILLLFHFLQILEDYWLALGLENCRHKKNKIYHGAHFSVCFREDCNQKKFKAFGFLDNPLILKDYEHLVI